MKNEKPTPKISGESGEYEKKKCSLLPFKPRSINQEISINTNEECLTEKIRKPSPALIAELDEIREEPYVNSSRKHRDISKLIINNLKDNGKLYKTSEERCYYFEKDAKSLFELDSPQFDMYLNEYYGVNSVEREYKFLIKEIAAETFYRGITAQLHDFSYFNQSSNVLYVSNNKNQFYKLDSDSIKLEDNGTDNVIFVTNPKYEHFELDEKRLLELNKGCPKRLLNSLLIDDMTFEECALTNNEARYLFDKWIKCIFFASIMTTKPICAFLGETNSGKTSALRSVGKILFGSSFGVFHVSKQDAFWSAAADNRYMVLDNLDEKIDWLNDCLATIATGIKVPLRKLYSTNENILITPRCFPAITSRTPSFKREDVVNRLLIFRMQHRESLIPEEVFQRKISEKRNQIMTEILFDLNQIVSGYKNASDDFTTSFRIADFAQFGHIASAVKGEEEMFKELLRKIENEQESFLYESNTEKKGKGQTCFPIKVKGEFQIFEKFISNEENLGKQYKAGELYKKLSELAKETKNEMPFSGYSQLGIMLNDADKKLALEKQLGITIDIKLARGNAKTYVFCK